MAFLLRVGHRDTVPTLESPPGVDRREEVMEREGPLSVLVLVGPDHDLVEGDLPVRRDGDHVGMDVGCALVQMYDKREDVLLPEPAGERVIHVAGPALNLLAPIEALVAGTRREVDRLSAEGQLGQALVRAADDEVHDGPVFRIIGTTGVGVLDPAGRDVLQVFLRDGPRLVHGLDLPAADDLEVQARARAVDAAVLVRPLPALLGPAPLVLVALRRRESFLRLEVDHLFLRFHFAWFLRLHRILSLPCPAC